MNGSAASSVDTKDLFTFTNDTTPRVNQLPSRSPTLMTFASNFASSGVKYLLRHCSTLSSLGWFGPHKAPSIVWVSLTWVMNVRRSLLAAIAAFCASTKSLVSCSCWPLKNASTACWAPCLSRTLPSFPFPGSSNRFNLFCNRSISRFNWTDLVRVAPRCPASFNAVAVARRKSSLASAVNSLATCNSSSAWSASSDNVRLRALIISTRPAAASAALPARVCSVPNVLNCCCVKSCCLISLARTEGDSPA